MSVPASHSSPRTPLNTPRRRALCLALATALATAALPATAQEAATQPAATELDTMVVVGSRLQAREEIDTRREAVAIVDSLSADEIGAMPDLTIAESLRRITGVTTVYNDDIGQFASIRGSHPDFVPVTINGLTIATTGDHGEGTRKVNLQVIPTNAVQQLQAFKTLSPELDAGALAGLINIVPSSAFDMGQPLVNATLGTSYSTYMDVPDDNRGGRDGVSSPWGRSARFAWAPTFANDTIGLLVTGIYQQRPRVQSNNAIVNRMYYNDAGQITTPDSVDWNGYGAPDSFVSHSYTNVFTKHGGTVNLDWRPHDRFNASLFGFAYLSDEQETRNSNRIVTLNQHRDQTADTGTANIRAADTQWRFNDFNRDQMGIQGKAEWDFVDRGRLTAHLGRSKAWYRSDRPFSAFRVQNAGRLSYNLTDLDRIFIPENGDILLDPANFTNWNVYKDRREAHSYVTEAKVDFGFNDRSEDRGWGFSTGLNYRAWDMERDNTATQYARGQVTLDGLAFTPDFDIPGYSWPALWQDADEFWSNVVPGMEIDEETSLYNSLANDYQYREKVVAGYVNGVYATDDFRLSGGMRLDRTEFDAEMASVSGGVAQPGKALASGSNTEVLPYFNAIWALSPDLRIKGSASKTLGRANPEMIATVENINEEEFTLSRGNPAIKPRQSTNLDLGMEYYFNEGLGMLTLTGFYKDISDDILNMSWEETIEDEVWTVTSPINGEDTTYKGVELGVIQSSFVALHPTLAPLGASANMMWIDGKSSYIFGGGIQEIDQLQYQSKFAGNAAVFWSFNNGSELRVAVNHQGNYVESFAANSWDTLWIQPLTTVDLTAKWNVKPGLQLRLSGRNIFSKSRGRTIGPTRDLHRAGLEIGSTWFLDLNYRF